MIAVDTSAVMAFLLNEPAADACLAALGADGEKLVSAGTLAELLAVAGRRNRTDEVFRLLDELDFTVVPLTAASARRVGDAYSQWGRGVHPAGLNLGDCFAYAVAKEHGCPLLYVGGDFAKTDIVSVL